MSLCHLFKMRTFNHESYPVKVIFGNNTLIKIVDEVKRLKSSHVLLLSTPFQEDLAQRVSQLLKESESPVKITLYSKAVMHTPIEVTQDAMKNMDDVDCIIAVGGGSTTGLSKAITLQKAGGMHQIIVPTTYAGSEATPVVGQTQDQKKTTTRDMKILPGTIIYDVSLTLTLPPLMTCTSGLNAIAHSVEALYATTASPISDMYAIRGIRLMMDALSKIQTLSGNEDKQEDILDARSDALESSWLCGTVLGWVHMGLHHKICHTLGGQLNTPHAETHAILLPHTLLYNFSSLDKRQQSLFKEAFDVEDGLSVAKRIRNVLIAQQGVPTSLQQLGVQKDELEKVAKAAVAAPYPNPRQLDEKSVLHMLQNAWEGTLSE